MITYGRNTVIEALKSNFKVTEVYIEETIRSDDKISKLLDLASEKNSKLINISHKKLSKLIGNDEHQGVACKVDFFEYKLKDILEKNVGENNSMIYISEATYEHNIGAIIRTAECAGLMAVILPQSLNITPTIAKISTGALFHIPIIRQSIFQTIKEVKKYQYYITGIERNGVLLNKANISNNNLFIIGGEDKSLTKPVSDLCDQIIEIPQFGLVNSLNMSVAAGIIIYEYVRQKLLTN